MKTVLQLALALLLFTPLTPLRAQTDNCAGAPLIPISTTNSCGSNWIDVDLAGSSASTSDLPIPTCGNYGGGQNDRWFRITVPTGITSLGFGIGMTTPSTYGFLNDMKPGLEVYRGNCGSLTPLLCHGTCTGFFCLGVSGFAPQTVTGLVPGETLWIRSWEGNGQSPAFKVLITTQQSAPANDECTAPLPLSSAGCNFYADAESWSSPSTSCSDWNTVDNSVYYSFTVTNATVQPVSITLFDVNCAGGCNDLQMAIYGPTTNCTGIGGEGASFHGCATGTGTVTVTSTTNPLPNGTYMLAVDGCSAELPAVGAFCTFGISGTVVPLPMHTVDLSARAVDARTVALSWATETINNPVNFTVERSENGTDFEDIGSPVPSVTGKLNYAFRDDAAPLRPGAPIWYRLRETDLDGNSWYGVPVAVYLDENEVAVSVIPRAGELSLQYYMPESGMARIEVMDLAGKVIYTESQSVEAGSHQQSMPFTAAPGIYLARVTTAWGAASARFAWNR